MTTLQIEVEDARPIEVMCDAEHLVVKLQDGRVLQAPLRWYPRLLGASAAQRSQVELMPMGIHWPAVDEDISVVSILRGQTASARTQSVNSKWQVATAAELFAAARFARLGFNVSVQYGANQPEYDLMVDKDGQTLKVSVKGSADGGWGVEPVAVGQTKARELSRRRGCMACTA